MRHSECRIPTIVRRLRDIESYLTSQLRLFFPSTLDVLIYFGQTTGIFYFSETNVFNRIYRFYYKISLLSRLVNLSTSFHILHKIGRNEQPHAATAWRFHHVISTYVGKGMLD